MPIDSMLNYLKWLNIRQRLELNTLIFIYKMRRGDAPQYLCERLSYVGEVQPYNLRNAIDFRLQRARSSAVQKTLFYMGLYLFNLLPNNIKNEENFLLFKKQFIKNENL